MKKKVWQWGIDLIGPFPKGKGQVKFVIIAIDYLTKWVEAEPLATITEKRTTDFIKKNIICRYGVPYIIITNYGRQFNNNNFREFCRKCEIKNC